MSEASQLLMRARQSATRLGIPADEVLAHWALDERWCSGCRDWHLETRFRLIPSRPGERASHCTLGAHRWEPNWKAAQRWAHKHGHTGLCLDQLEGCYVRWGRQDHRHCACNRPMHKDAPRCGRCEREQILREGLAA